MPKLASVIRDHVLPLFLDIISSLQAHCGKFYLEVCFLKYFLF